MAGLRTETSLVDKRLRMLDAKSDRKGFGLDEYATPMQHLEGIACAVTEGEHDVVGADIAAVGKGHAAQLAPAVGSSLEADIVDALAEADFAAERLDLLAHVLDHA